MNKLTEVIVSAVQDKKAKNILTLDLKGLDGTICDYFVVCSADSTTQIASIIDEVEKRTFEELGDKVIRIEGKENGVWIAADFGDVIVHVFQTELRDYYRLEEMWSDAKITKHESFA